MKSKISIIVTILFVISMGLTSCSRQYNLTLIKRNNISANDVAQRENVKPIQHINPKEIRVVNVFNEEELVGVNSTLPKEVIVQENINRNEVASIAKDELGIDQNLYAENARLISYYPETKESQTEQSQKFYPDHSNQAFFLYIILAIFLPPVCVGLWEGGLTFDFWIDLLLTFCFWIPGVIFAFFIILR
jgi:uncharacterized membrane protein YqaE (UPF0057 family)